MTIPCGVAATAAVLAIGLASAIRGANRRAETVDPGKAASPVVLEPKPRTPERPKPLPDVRRFYGQHAYGSGPYRR